MEELQSTENLEREILEDAKKKACKILKTADEIIKNNSAQWTKKTSFALSELEKNFDEHRRLAEVEIMAVLPMDKRRVRAEKLENALRGAVDTWYFGLSRDQVTGFLINELKKRIAVYDGLFAQGRETSGFRAVIHKLTMAEAEIILKEVFPKGNRILQYDDSEGFKEAFPEIILENNDVRISASVAKTAGFFLNEKRAELVEALLGKSALNEME